MEKEIDLALIIPAWCEEKRLPNYLPFLISELENAPFQTALQIVDDGSPESSWKALELAIPPVKKGNCEVRKPLRMPVNRGKGATILAGWESVSDGKLLCFVDADGAIPASCVRDFLSHAIRKSAPLCLIGARSGAADVKRGPLRRIVSVSFQILTALILGRHVHDTQCGLKAVSRDLFSQIRPLISEYGFAFDVNLLLAAETVGVNPEEFPVGFRDIAGGSVHIIRHGRKMLSSLLRLRKEKNRWPEILKSTSLLAR